MNVFVLCTGRCGSTTFIKACAHIANFSSAHESRCALLGPARLAYPENHIEADNRLSWLLGRLEKAYGNKATYIHLKRDVMETAESFVKRYERGIIKAYRGSGILMGLPEAQHPLDVALDYCETVNSNIEVFLRDKTNKMTFHLEEAKSDFSVFWNLVGAAGNLENALNEFDTKHNASPMP